MAVAGKVTKVSPLLTHSSGARYYLISHNVPVYNGDSGGPLLTKDLQVAGINTAGAYWYLTGAVKGSRPLFTRTRSIAVLPDVNWLKETIAKDRATHR